MDKFYITTAIDYVNGPPHIGHAYEKILTDIIARHFRQRRFDTYFLTGTDEHGTKIEKTAACNNMKPQEFCDSIVQIFKNAWQLLSVDYDGFIRTTDDFHEKAVQDIFQKLLDKGDIYKARYAGIYCPGCECFLNERDLAEDGLCPDHQAKPQEVEEENYFFKLSKYKDKIKEHIKNNPEFILPAFRANEVINQLEDTEDISVSRHKCAVSWGIPVPNDEDQVIYVWIDALSNYITALGYGSDDNENFNRYWPADVHMIGKDILKFHSIYWISILMALEVELPKTILAHGWITVDQTKMSKSVGNVISPGYILENFNLPNADAARYYLATCASLGRDGNYNDEDFKLKVNADLANNLGNLLNRTLNMLIKYFDGNVNESIITKQDDNKLAELCKTTSDKVKEEFNGYKIAEAAEAIFTLVNEANKYVNDKAPWALAKNEDTKNECGQVLYNVLETLRQVSIMLFPYIPNISSEMWEQLAQECDAACQTWDDLYWGGLKAGRIASKETVKPVFLRLDSEVAGKEKKKKVSG